MVKQTITDNYCLYLGDCCQVLPKLPDESVDFSVYSPPFWSVYTYSDSREDLSNSSSYEEFLDHYDFLISEHFRLMVPGRIVAVHCMDMPTFKRGGEEMGLKDFPGDIVRRFQKGGFIYHSRHCIWKDPLIAATRTKALGLAHKQIIKDSSMCRTGIPDYMLAFRKPGENPKPIRHPRGLTEYHGSRRIPSNLDHAIRTHRAEHGEGIEKNPWDGRKDKRSHWIWQQYASPVWFDIRQSKVLQFREARGKDDERHICPLQVDIVERCLELWSTKGDIVLDPFGGVGTTGYVAVKNGRKAIMTELKESYFRQMAKNMRSAQRKTEGFSEVEKGE